MSKLNNRPVRPIIYPIGPSIAYVQLTQGQFACIDVEDAALLAEWNWQARLNTTSHHFYAIDPTC